MKLATPSARTISFQSDTSASGSGRRATDPRAAGDGRQFREARPIYLTPRELQVLSLLCEGLSNKLICRRLNIAPSTVKVHVARILGELGVSSRVQAVVMAQRLKLVPDEMAEEAEYGGITREDAWPRRAAYVLGGSAIG